MPAPLTMTESAPGHRQYLDPFHSRWATERTTVGTEVKFLLWSPEPTVRRKRFPANVEESWYAQGYPRVGNQRWHFMMV